MKELNGFKAWPADSDQSLGRYRSMLPNWFGLELKPVEKVYAIQGGVPSGGDSDGARGPVRVMRLLRLRPCPQVSIAGDWKESPHKTPAFRHLRFTSKQ